MNQQLAWAYLGRSGMVGFPVPQGGSVAALKETLPEREFQVMAMRFGLDGNEPHKLSEVAEKLGVSKERVRQLEYRALRYMRG